MRTVAPASANCTRPPLSVPSGPAANPAGSAVASTRQGVPGNEANVYVPLPASTAVTGDA